MKTEFVELRENMEFPVTGDTQFVLDLSQPDPDKKYLLNLIFPKEGISAEVIGLFDLCSEQRLYLTTIVMHKVPHTSCLTRIQGVLNDSSCSQYTGKIIIEKNAAGTSSFLEDHVLTLGNNVSNNSSPILQIDANDVKASHAATTGRVNEEQIYYLTSRGLSRTEATDLIVEGFLKGLLKDIRDAKIREEVYERLSHSTETI